jgi:hypothetical protein
MRKNPPESGGQPRSSQTIDSSIYTSRRAERSRGPWDAPTAAVFNNRSLGGPYMHTVAVRSSAAPRALLLAVASLLLMVLAPSVADAEQAGAEGQPITTAAQAASVAHAVAAEDGDANASVEVGAGSLPIEATGPDATAETKFDPATSYKVRLKGDFTIDASTPWGDPVTGEEMEIVLDKATGNQTLLWLKPPRVAATDAKAANVRKTASRRKPRAVAKAATWGNDCKRANNAHCYGKAVWTMSGEDEKAGGEQVLGCEAWQKTISMYVADWEQGARVDHEMWCAFREQEEWVEIGQVAGLHHNCCTLYAFWAFDTKADGYVESKAPEWTEAENTYYLDYIESMPAWKEGAWCFFYDTEEQACYAGFPTYSNELQDGTEIGSEDWPDSEEKTITEYIADNGESHWWKEATDVNVRYAEPGEKAKPDEVTCTSANTEYPYAGNIYVWIC